MLTLPMFTVRDRTVSETRPPNAVPPPALAEWPYNLSMGVPVWGSIAALARIGGLLTTISLSACRWNEVPEWPQKAPQPGTAAQNTTGLTLTRFLRERAGVGALDCGVDASESAVFGCSEKMFRRERAFYCSIRQLPQPTGDLDRVFLTTGSFAMIPVAIGFYSAGDGAFHSASIDRSGKIETELIFTKSGTNRPVRVGGFVRPPVLLTPRTTRITLIPRINGLLIFDCLISKSGTVDDAKIIKSIPAPVVERSEELVRATRFRPATIFGCPVPVYFNVSVRAEDGALSIVKYGSTK